MESPTEYRSVISKVTAAALEFLLKIPMKFVLLFFSLQIVIVIAAFVLFGIFPVSSEVKEMLKYTSQKATATDSLLNEKKLELISKIRASEHHEAFLRAALNLSKADSMALLIDLHDSTTILTYRGVYLLESKISSYSINKGLRKLPVFLRDSLYSGPMQAQDGIASIEKFPIVVKKAPKDTTEANQANAVPVLPTQSDVFFLYRFDNSLIIEIEQEEIKRVGNPKALAKYNKEKQKSTKTKNLSFLFGSEPRGYTYRLTVKIPREDARSIYRALPQKPFVVVRYR